jgi:hypothetical protein
MTLSYKVKKHLINIVGNIITYSILMIGIIIVGGTSYGIYKLIHQVL